MKGLAKFVMRGRWQALLVSLLGAGTILLAWLSASVIALVILRRGHKEGAFLLAFALLPAGYFLTLSGDLAPLSLLLGATVLAMVLRWTVSLQLTLLASVAVGVVTGYALLLFGTVQLENYAAQLAKVFEDLQARLPEGQLVTPGISTIAGLLGLMNALSCVVCLLLARYWQAALYNPGGFREEFHGLRLAPQFSVGLVLMMLGLGFAGSEYRPWAMLFALPLSIAGLGYIHARAAQRKLGSGWLGIFYLLWLLIDLVKLVVAGVAVADSFIDLRSRWRRTGSGKDIQ